jgi:hypothetical protein
MLVMPQCAQFWFRPSEPNPAGRQSGARTNSPVGIAQSSHDKLIARHSGSLCNGGNTGCSDLRRRVICDRN